MRVITTKSGPFAFGGINVVHVKKGKEYEGAKAEQLLKSGWAEEVSDTEGEAKQKAAEAQRVESKRLAEEAEKKRTEEEAKQKAADDEAEMLATAQKQANLTAAETKVADALDAVNKATADLAEKPEESSLKGKLTKATKTLEKATDELNALKG